MFLLFAFDDARKATRQVSESQPGTSASQAEGGLLLTERRLLRLDGVCICASGQLWRWHFSPFLFGQHVLTLLVGVLPIWHVPCTSRQLGTQGHAAYCKVLYSQCMLVEDDMADIWCMSF